MEIIGTNQSGKVVRADFATFASDNAGDDEEFNGFGSSKTMARYVNRKTGEYREADVRELAMQGGISDPSVNFKNNDTMKKWSQPPKIDQSIAYNLEAIKTDRGRKAYLQDKGIQSFFNDGDNYYKIENGYISPLNNDTEGIMGTGVDLSDLTRLAANAGKTIGAAAGVMATGLGVAATGGAALPLAAAAGAGGAVVGGAVQRLAESALGADASKYNREMTSTEEGQELLKTAGLGAIEGFGGQVTSAVFGKVKSTVSGKVADLLADTSAGKVTANYAARAEESYIQAQLPTSYKSLLGTPAQARAQSLLDSTKSKDTPLDAVKLANKEAKELISGRVKPSSEKLAETQNNKILMEIAQKQQAGKAASEEAIAEMSMLKGATQKDLTEKYKQGHYEIAKDFYKDSKIDVDEVFKEGGDIEKTKAIVRAAEAETSKRLKNIGVKFSDDGTGVPNGIDEASLKEATKKMFNENSEALALSADREAAAAFTFDKYPDDYYKPYSTNRLTEIIINADKATSMNPKMKDEVLKSLRGLQETIKTHSSTVGQGETGFSLMKFMKESRKMASNPDTSPQARKALKDANEVLFDYAVQGAKDPQVVDRVRQMQQSSIDLSTMIRGNLDTQPDGLSLMLKKFDATSKQAGFDETRGSSLAFAWNMKNTLNGTTNPEAWANMTSLDRQAAKAFMGVRNWEKFGIKKVAPEAKDQSAEFAKNLLIEGPKTIVRQMLAKPTIAAAKTVAKGVTKAANIPVVKRTAKYYGIETGAEMIKGKLQNFTGSSDNRD